MGVHWWIGSSVIRNSRVLELLTSRSTKPRNPIVELGTTTVRCRRLCKWMKDLWIGNLHSDSWGDLKSRFSSIEEGIFENDPESRRSGEETLWGDRVDLLSSMFKGSLSLNQPSIILLTFQVGHPCLNCTWWFYLFTSSLGVCFMSIDGGYIKDLLRRISSYQIYHIIYEMDIETSQYLGACSPQRYASSWSTMGLHHW